VFLRVSDKNLAGPPRMQQISQLGVVVDSQSNWGILPVARILVVDDDPAVQTIIRLLLERAGHQVTLAGDGLTGLAAFERDSFDLLFLDIFMPGMDGLETMRLIHRQQPALPIIVVSGRPLPTEMTTEPDFLDMATKLGAIRSLPKPFKPMALMTTVEACLNWTTQPARDDDAAASG
jgi:CheY-like chemotaxis protein